MSSNTPKHLDVRLILDLALHELKNKYRGSVLGFTWLLLQPALTVGVLWAAVIHGFKRQSTSGGSSLLWILSGFLAWLFFSEGVIQGTQSIIEKGYLLKKVRFNFFDLPLIKTLSVFIVHLALLFLLLLGLFFSSTETTSAMSSALILPYYLLANFLLVLGLVRLLSLIQVVFRDLAQVVQFTVTILFWVSPIFWEPAKENMPYPLHLLVQFNPVNFVLSGYRQALLNTENFAGRSVDHVCFWAGLFLIWALSFLLGRRLNDEITDFL